MKLKHRSKKSNVPDRRQRPVESDLLQGSTQFRRNRTMSGVRRATADVPSDRERVHQLTHERRRLGTVFLAVIIGIILLGGLLLQFTARAIMQFSIQSPSQQINSEQYEHVVIEYLGLNPAERLRFLLNENELSTYATSVYPEVESITQIGVENFVETQFSVTFRKPVAGWSINNKQYYVDGHGVVFEKNYYKSPGVTIVDESGVSPEQGKTIASARLLGFVGRVVALSKDRGLEVVKATLPSGTTRQLNISIKGKRPYVKFTIDRVVGEQVEDMARVLTYLSERRISASYVDVRVSGRAAYR